MASRGVNPGSGSLRTTSFDFGHLLPASPVFLPDRATKFQPRICLFTLKPPSPPSRLSWSVDVDTSLTPHEKYVKLERLRLCTCHFIFFATSPAKSWKPKNTTSNDLHSRFMMHTASHFCTLISIITFLSMTVSNASNSTYTLPKPFHANGDVHLGLLTRQASGFCPVLFLEYPTSLDIPVAPATSCPVVHAAPTGRSAAWMARMSAARGVSDSQSAALSVIPTARRLGVAVRRRVWSTAAATDAYRAAQSAA